MKHSLLPHFSKLLPAVVLATLSLFSACGEKTPDEPVEHVEPVGAGSGDDPDPETAEAGEQITTQKETVDIAAEDSRSRHFAEVNSHLDLGGTVYAYLDIDTDLGALSSKLDETLKLVAGMDDSEIPEELENLDLRVLAEDLGLEGLRAVGLSSVKMRESYRNKLFLYTPEGRKGLFTLLGDKPGPFLSWRLAPADADLVYETDLKLKNANDLAQKISAQFPQGPETLEEQMQQQFLSFSMTVGEFFNRFDSKLVVVGRVDPEETTMIPGGMEMIEVPAFDLGIAVENLNFLWDELKRQFPPESLAEGPAQVEFIEGENYEAYIAMDMMNNPRLRPAIHFQKDRNLIVLATSKEFIAEMLTPAPDIRSNAQFAASVVDLPTEGNGFGYATPRLFEKYRSLLELIMSTTPSGTSDVPEELMDMIMDWSVPEISEPVVGVSVNQTNGIWMVGNSYQSHKQTLLMAANPLMLSVLASMAMPAYTQIQGNAKATKEINNVRQLILACRMYAADWDGAFPETLEDLYPDYLDVEEMLSFQDPNTGLPVPYTYNAGLTDTSFSKLVLIASPAMSDGKVVVGFVGGNVEAMTAFEYLKSKLETEEFLKEQAPGGGAEMSPEQRATQDLDAILRDLNGQ